jgi:hypothetical protein
MDSGSTEFLRITTHDLFPWPTSSVGKEAKFRSLKSNGDAKRWAAAPRKYNSSKLVNFEPQVEFSSTGKL